MTSVTVDCEHGDSTKLIQNLDKIPFITSLCLNKIHFGYKLHFLSILIQERVMPGKEELDFIHSGASFDFYVSHLRF